MENGKTVSFFQKPKTKEGLFILALVIIPLIHFVVFWVYVNSSTIIKTFFSYNDSTGEYTWNGIDRYITLFREFVLGINADGERDLRVLKSFNTFWNSFRAIAINIILYPIVVTAAYAFYKKIRFEKLFRICFYIPQLISISVLAIMYRSLFNADYGPISLMFESMGKPIEFLSSNSDHMWTIIYIFAIWTGLGANVIMISGAMLRIPADISEYCQLEGVGFWRELFQIVIPLIMPTLGVYMINILLSVFAFTMQPMMITFNNAGEAGKYYTVGWYIFDAAQQNAVGSSIYASTLGLLLTVIMTPFIVTARVLVKKFTPDVQF